MARSVPGPVIGLPCSETSPASGLIRPSRILRKVLLPQPEGPTIERNSPSLTSMSKACSARTGARFGGRKVRLTLRPWIYAAITSSPLGAASASALGPHALVREPRQHLGAEIGQLREVIDKGQPDPTHARFADRGELIGDAVGRADERIAADRIGGEVAAFGIILVGRNCLRRDAFVSQHAVNCVPVGVLDDGVLVILVRLILRRTADHLADGEYFYLAAEPLRLRLDLSHLRGVAGKRFARARRGDEKGIAVA